MPKGFPGTTNVAFMKLDPKSKPIKSAAAYNGKLQIANIVAVYNDTR